MILIVGLCEQMQHDVFGEIAYNRDDEAWSGSCSLPVFAQFGKLPPDNYLLREPEPGFERGVFAFTVQDETGEGPSGPQAEAFRFLLAHEADVCDAVFTEVLEATGHGMDWLVSWLQKRRESRFWGGLAKLVGPQYRKAEDLKQAARCTGFEISRYFDGAYAYIAFYFVTIWGLEDDHGFSVIYHPEKEAFSGTGDAIWECLP